MQVEARYLIEQSRGFIAEGNISKAVKTLRLVADSFGITKTKEELDEIASRYYDLEIYIMAGTIDEDFSSVQKSRIRQRLLQISNELAIQLKHEKLDVEVKVRGPVEKQVTDWLQTLFA
ncbi:MAG: hypothetical protein KF734_13700 [Saprospiraceae bacterium]|nr:hypothetical protein [Saprospiraceae bacterium]